MVKIPNKLEDLYPAGTVDKLLDVLQQPDLAGKMRDALDKVRRGEVNPLEKAQHAWQQARTWIESLATDSMVGSESTLINATGQLLSERIVRVPTSSSVAHAYANAAIQFQNRDVVSAKARATVQNAFGNAVACWQVSVKSALDSLVAAKTVLVAKTDLVRIPGLGDVGTLLRHLAVSEIGATNGCSKVDWQRALEDSEQSRSQCVLLVSPNGLARDTAEQQRVDAIAVASQAGVPVYELVADAVINPKLADEYAFPVISKRLEQSVDVIVVPLNLLLGGPAGAISIGSEGHVRLMQQSAGLDGSELTSPELVAAKVAIQLSLVDDESSSWPASSLLLNPENLQNRAQRIAIQLNDNSVIKHAQELQHTTQLAPPPWDRYSLENWAVEVEPRGGTEELVEQLRTGKLQTESGSIDPEAVCTPIECTLGRQGCLLLDLRFVDPRDDHLIVSALS